MPPRPWIGQQAWLDLAFIHFEADPAILRALIPCGLDLELFDGKAWIGLVPFRMEGVTGRGLPAPSFLCDFPEFNVRTYVTNGKKPGVWFFSLDVPSRLAVWVARRFFHLPYFRAAIHTECEFGKYDYCIRRDEHVFEASYLPGAPVSVTAGSFANWATERYCLYSQSVDGRLFRGEIQHPKWPLRSAQLEIRANSFSRIPLGRQHPDVYFSPRVDVVIWPLEQIG